MVPRRSGSALVAISVLSMWWIGIAGCGTAAVPTSNNTQSTTTSGGSSGGGGAANGGPAGDAAASCPSVSLADAGPGAFPGAPQTPPPEPGSNPYGSVCVSSPGNGASVTSPMTMTATAELAQATIGWMRVYIDGSADYFTTYNQFTTRLWMAAGTHTLEVLAADKNGNQVSTSLTVNVTGTAYATVDNIQNLEGWESCSAVYPDGSPVTGPACAAGLGTAVSTMTQGVSSPSLSGSSAHFTMGGSTGYSNELYTMPLGGGHDPTRLVYDFYVMVDKPEAPQALEFDVNQTINDTRWTWGTECNFNGNYPQVGEWDVWNGAGSGSWEKTSVQCPQFAANQWQHIVITMERAGQQVHYISLQVNGTNYPLDLYYDAQQNWPMGGINVAFQMDGNYRQEAYNVWLDEVSLTLQ